MATRHAPDSDQDGIDWMDLTRRCAFESHRLLAWIHFDPLAIENHAALGVPGVTYYIASRAAPLASAGNEAVVAAFSSIDADAIRYCLDECRRHTTFDQVRGARNAAVVAGLRQSIPERCDQLAAMADDLWVVADVLPRSGRVFFAAHLDVPRPRDDDLLSAWLALYALREFRGDTHWAIHLAEGLSGTVAGVLDNAMRGFDDEWVPRSRGADDAVIGDAHAELERRGLSTQGSVNEEGLRYRQELEDRLDRATAVVWQTLGVDRTMELLRLLEPVSQRFVDRIDATAGDNWVPAGRVRRWTHFEDEGELGGAD